MKRILTKGSILAGLVLLVSLAFAEEFRTPVQFTSDVNFDSSAVVKIAGTTLTATAAQLNACGSGATATVTPTTATVSNLLTVSKTLVRTPETITLTKGAFTLTPTQSLYFVAGQYGVVTMNIANATYTGQQLTLINLVGTNVVVEDGTMSLVTFPSGYTTWTNGQYRGMHFVGQSTNWINTGTF